MTALLEERDAANEELQTANEEIRTSNEELQSTNEELETSREELQVINEELTTSNQELQIRNEQLKAAQDYAEAIVETVREPLVVLSEDFRVQRANLAFYQFFQVVPQETERRTLDELGDGQWNSPHLRTRLEQVLTSHHSFRDFEVVHRFPRIGTKTMLLNARRMLRAYEQGQDHLLLLAMEDITERREAERQKEALLGMVSHELKNPLTSASLSTQLLRRMLEQAGIVQALPLLQKLGKHHLHLEHLIDDLLDATAIEAGTLRLRPVTFAIDVLVQEVVEQQTLTHPAHHLVIEETAATTVYADRERTGQVLTNLLSNAIKYGTATEPIVVRIQSAEAEAEVQVQVQDHGQGIPIEQQAHIFERFYRVTGPSQTEAAGLGLGLYLTAQLVKQQGGRIWVESREGMGSTFSFTLPRPGAI